MKSYVNYERKKIDFSLPKGWNLISNQDKPPIAGVSNPLQEIRNFREGLFLRREISSMFFTLRGRTPWRSGL